MESLRRESRRGLRECTDPAGKFVNAQSAVFPFGHVRDSQKEAIESGASAAACWYVKPAPRVFNAPAEIWYGQIRGGFLANDPAATRSLASGGGAAAAAIPQEVPVVALLKRLAAGERVSNEEIFETLDPLPSVIVGDVASCRRKIEAYADIGVDRLMCLLQFRAQLGAGAVHGALVDHSEAEVVQPGRVRVVRRRALARGPEREAELSVVVVHVGIAAERRLDPRIAEHAHDFVVEALRAREIPDGEVHVVDSDHFDGHAPGSLRSWSIQASSTPGARAAPATR